MFLTIKFIGALRHLSGKAQLKLFFQEEISVRRLIDKICQEQPELKRTYSEQDLNEPKSNSIVLVNGREISVLNGLDTKLVDGDEVILVPVVHGG